MYYLTLPNCKIIGHHTYISYLEVLENKERRLIVVNCFIMKLKENFIFSILKWIKNINEKHEEKQDSRNEEVRLNRKKEREGGK